ncbi:MAG: hypothetical protein AB2731_12115 [Candidatus Thiodiazotropha sp.]
MRKNTPYPQILEFLTDLVDKKASGTLFVHSDSNHVITIALNSGRIHALYYGAKRGRKAIPLISTISGGSFRLEKSSLVETFHDLPSTPELLNLLRNPHAEKKPKPAASSTEGINNKAIGEDKKDILCQELKSLLVQRMGPIAEIVFDDAVDEIGDFCATPQLTEDLINKLSEEIDNSAEEAQFRDEAYVTLSKILNS